MNNENRFCKKCLLKDLVSEEYLEHVKTYLDGLDELSKVEEEVYQERLLKCMECENLNEGLCKICGCFVEFRAVMKNKGCPWIHPKW